MSVADDIDKRIGQYIDIRDALKRLDEKQALERQPLLLIQERLAGIIRTFMESNNITKNLKSASGTAILSTRYTASLADPDAFMRFVISTGKFELMDRRANTAAVRDFVQANNELPAGCNLTGVQTLGVRRPSGGKHEPEKDTS
jgi:hypothetical protein